MYRRTFEILAKYVGREHNIKVYFDNPGSQAHANMKSHEIHLPENIGNENALAALALLMHEAAHIRYSTKIPMDKIVKCQEDHAVLNTIEDVRIDIKNFSMLNNVKDFYRELIKQHVDIAGSKADQAVKALCAGIFECEGFSPKLDPETQKIMDHKDGKGDRLVNKIQRGVNYIEHNDWHKLSKEIKNIRKQLKMDKSTPLTEQTKIALGLIKDPKDKGSGNDPTLSVLTPMDGSIADQLEKLTRPASGWGSGDPMKGASYVGHIDLDAMTRDHFKELLCMKTRKTIPQGMQLDTDNLTAYYLGDIESLFKEEKIIKTKKSRILFLIDASGSMSSPLMDGSDRAETVKRSVSSLIDILEEVRHTESIDVAWSVSGFTHSYQSYPNDSWEEKYQASGGTCIENGVTGAIKDLLKDYSIDGKRILIIFSDGDVSSSEINTVKKLINSKNGEIRTLVVGVGTEVTGSMATEIVGDNIILGKDDADFVLMETIKAMLDD